MRLHRRDSWPVAPCEAGRGRPGRVDGAHALRDNEARGCLLINGRPRRQRRGDLHSLAVSQPPLPPPPVRRAAAVCASVTALCNAEATAAAAAGAAPAQRACPSATAPLTRWAPGPPGRGRDRTTSPLFHCLIARGRQCGGTTYANVVRRRSPAAGRRPSRP